MNTLVERLEAEAARTEFIEAREFNAKIQGTRPKHPEPLRALLREAAAALRATGEGERLLRCVMEDYAKHGYVTAAVLDEITTTLAAAPTPSEPLRDEPRFFIAMVPEDRTHRLLVERGWSPPAPPINPTEVDSKLIEPLRDAGAVALVGERGSVSWRSEHILPVGTPLYTRPDPQRRDWTWMLASIDWIIRHLDAPEKAARSHYRGMAAIKHVATRLRAALAAHPAPQQPAITDAMVSDAMGIPRGDAALIVQVEDGNRKINGRWLSHLPAAAARINAALAAAAQEGKS